MARYLGKEPNSFYKYFKGDRTPWMEITAQLGVLGVDLNWFASETDISEKEYRNSHEYKKGGEPGRAEEPPSPDFFAHINEENLSETERSLLEEAKLFSDFLKNLSAPLQVKRLMLQLMIEHIDQEIEQLRSSRSSSNS